ncbi:hypothetical protein AB0P02_01305 [Streptomyces griseoluteus]|uniref:hypothetical protein n=1 Tax=Streptomyces griseoluteus TaxID=29306 RepID=UPI003424120B
MAFPEDPLGTRVELQIGTTWTDVTPYAQLGDIITHTRGRTGEGQAVDPASCSLTLKSPAGLFSPRNPRSPYFGQIGRNTPMRVSVLGGAPALSLPGGTTRATTPDAAPLDVTGDIDIRLDATLIDWLPLVDTELCGKWGNASQRSWMLNLTPGGFLRLWWSPDSNTIASATSTAALLMPPSGRMTVRATLDVDNGASGRTITFYMGTSTAGPWTQLGDVITQSGVTSIFNSSAPVELGAVGNIAYADPVGRYHRAEIRAGINGTLVASPDFTAQTIGATSFTDSTGRTWSVTGGAEISNRRWRFVGEFSDWPAKWSSGAHLIRVDGDGAGILRRLSQGKKPLASTLRRRIPTGSPRPLAYWPMEDGESAVQAASALSGGQPLRVSGMAFGGDDHPSGSGPLPVLGQVSTLDGRVPGAQAGGWHVEMVYRLAALPATEQTMLSLQLAAGTGGAAQIVCRVSTAGIRVQVLDADSNVIVFYLHTSPASLASFVGVWNRLQIYSAVNGAQTTVTVAWLDVVANIWTWAYTTYTGTPGKLVGVKGLWGNSFQGMSIGHLAAYDVGGTGPLSPGVYVYDSADDGFARERAAARLARLSAEEGLPIAVAGVKSTSALQGPQRPATLLELLDQVAAVDGGILVEDRDRLGLRYRVRTSLYNQVPVLTLPYGSKGLGALEPVEDDTDVRNDVTVERIGGSSGRAELAEGRMSTQDPPIGIGRYDDSVSLNLYADADAEPMAWWLLYLGTWDEPRYPTITIRLHRRPELIPAILDLVEGDMIRITDLPSHLPPGPVDLLIQGYTERIGVRTWEIDLVCAPAGPYRVAVTDDPVLGMVDTDGSQLVTAATETDTTLVVQSTAGPEWRWEQPFDARVGGEVVTVSGIAPAVADAFGRTASSGWGSPDTGGSWSTVGGNASDYSVSSGLGRVSLASINVNRFCLLPSPTADVDLVVSVSTSALAAGGPHYVGLVARYLDANNHLFARLAFGTDQSIKLVLQRRFTTQTDLASATLGITHAVNTLYRVRFQVQGSTLRARAWRASDPEPASTWHVVATDSALTAAGSIGVRSILDSANTNSLPVVAAYDDFALLNPQRFTVARSVNGVVKPQLAGADVRLAYSPRIAL